MRFVGVDLTDPYAQRPRGVDVAIVDEEGRCDFAVLSGSQAAADLGSLARTGDVLVIDGPLALAAPGARMRECERILRCAGKTPDALPLPRSRPYAGFVRGSVELAARLAASGWSPVVDGLDITSATMLEAYPGCSWTALAGARLPRKSTREGFAARLDLLSRNGLRFSSAPRSHDQCDAALCAWLGWSAHRASGRVALVGRRTFTADGHLREGAIVQLNRPDEETPPRLRPAPLGQRSKTFTSALDRRQQAGGLRRCAAPPRPPALRRRTPPGSEAAQAPGIPA